MMIGSGNNLNRGSAFLPSNMPSLPQCLPLEPITLGNQKNCSGELKRALGVSSGNALEDRPFGVVHLKRQPPVASKELKHFKDSVQDSSRRARERADMLSESLFKLDKYREAMSSKKRQRSEVSSSERLSGGNLSKVGSQIHRNGHDVVIYRMEDRAKSVGLNKRARSSISDVQQPEARFTTMTNSTTFLEKDSDDGSIRSEEKTRKLLAGGEGLDQKIKKKRSVGAVGYRVNNGDREIKRATHTKLNSDSKLRSFDAQGHRLKSSSGVNGMNRLDGSSDPTSSDASTISKNEPESGLPLKGRTYILEQRMLKGNNRPINRDDNSSGSPCTVIKAKVSRGPRTGSIVGLDSSPNIHSSSETHQSWESASVSKAQLTGLSSNPKHVIPTGSSLYPVTQWVGQRHKNSRSRRSKLLPPVPDLGEIPSPSQDFAASDFGPRTNMTDGSVLASSVDNNTMKFKKEVDNVSSPSGLSESEESGPGDDKVKLKDTSSGKFSLSAGDEAGSSILPARKNKVLVNEKGDNVRKQGRSGRGSTIVKPDSPLVRDKSESPFAEKPLHSMKPISGKIRSKSGRPPSKKLKDRKGSAHVGLTCRSSDITGESDDDQEELFEAAKSARNANIRACTGPFWHKVNSIFISVSPADVANLKQQLGLAEELSERLSQMQDMEHEDLGVHITETNCSEEIRGSNFSKEFILSGSKGGRFDVGRLDKTVPLYHRVLSALIEEHDCDEYYHQSEGKHTFLQSASDDSHCGSCNLNDYEHRDRDRLESEAESTIDFQIPKNNVFDRFSCDKSAVSNLYRNPSISGFIHGGEQWQGDEDLSNCDVGHTSEICSNDSFQLQSGDFNVPSISSNCHYQMMRLNDKLLLELQSIGLYPETLPDLTEGEDLINQEIMEHKRSLYQQIGRKRRNLEKVEQSIKRAKDMEKREVEEVAMDQLVEMAYNKKMGYRGSTGSKSTVRRVSKSAARSLMQRTLARCHKFEDTGISCFNEPALQDIIFSTPPPKRDAKTVDFGDCTTATNAFYESSRQMDDRRLGAVSGPSERYDSQSDTLDKGSSNAQAINSSELVSVRGSMMIKQKKREMRIDEVAGSASSRLTPGTKGKRSDRERDPNKNHPLSNFFGPSLDGCQGVRRSRPKPRQKGSCLSASGARSEIQLSEVPESFTSQSSKMGAKFSDRTRGIDPVLPANFLVGSSKDADESTGLRNLQLHDLDAMEDLDVSKDLGDHQDLGSWLDIDEDGLQDHDAIGLEIPMDDLTELNMMV
ncbi:uncharacterized protein LOC103500151 isoform X1 [Cucumis melo]|uniref:Uncharacterized protein LOC103500151 isoform X1 n=1 Tax=Cucumis melo TaxID=3656 RepID=A0A1S3CEU6_CUCME|nr:uncharacterized protein LOC103500151 isoform X1 [Cucumis melo]XP_008461594.2 uncharacterized protein LOC103500151 isoform X1 [Cucumis melo]